MRRPRVVWGALLIPLFAAVFLFLTAWIATPTDLILKYLAPDVLVMESSTGNDVVFPLASTAAAGLMTPAHVRALGAPAVPGSGNLPLGVDGQILRWSSGAWTPSGENLITYVALTETNTFDAIKTAITTLLTRGGFVATGSGVTAASNFNACCRKTSNTDQINNTWPAGSTAPYVWVVTPAVTDWVEGFSVQYCRARINGCNSTESDLVESPVTLAIARDQIIINGNTYDWAVGQITGERADACPSPSACADVEFKYSEPAGTAVITQP